MHEAKGRTQPAPIHKLHYGEELFQLVFERRSGQHKRIAAFQLLDGARGGRSPVANALRLVQNNQVRLHLLHILISFKNQFIVDEIEKRG